MKVFARELTEKAVSQSRDLMEKRHAEIKDGMGRRRGRISVHHFGEVGWIPFLSWFFNGEIRVNPWFASGNMNLPSLTGDLGSSTWQGTFRLLVYIIDWWFGNFRGNIGCDIRMLVGHKFTFLILLILHVYMICVMFA